MTRIPFVLAVVLAQVPAQGTLPHALAGHWGETNLVHPWGRASSRWQQLADRSQLPPDLVPGRQITHLGVRRQSIDPLSAASLDTEVALYDTQLSAAGMGNLFAGNRGGGQGGVVFARRVVNLPATALLDPQTAVHFLPLDTPRLFTGPNLLVEIVNHGSGPSYTGWFANGAWSYGPDGVATDVGQKCGNFLNMILSNGPYRPGATFRVTEFYTSPGSVPINALGFSASVAGFGALPLDLTAFGAPGCVLHVSLDILVPGGGFPGFNVDYPVPADPSLSGARLYTQWLNADPAVNALGVTVSGVRAIALGSRAYALAHTERDNDDLDTFGTGPRYGEGSVVLLRYQ